jgi:hypothetical protein
MFGIIVNRLRALSWLQSGLALAVLGGNAYAEMPNRERETLNQLQETVERYRGEVERYHSEVQSYFQLQSRLSAVENVVTRWLAYGVVDDEKIASYLRAPMPKSATNITSIILVKERPGLWTLTFVPALKTRPVVLVTVGDAVSPRIGLASVSELDERGFKVRTSSDGVVLNDIEYSFVVLSAEPQ